MTSESGEFSPLLDRFAPTRASYTQGIVDFEDKSTRSASSSQKRNAALKRAQSVPVLTRHGLHTLQLSPMFYRKVYMAKGGTMLSSAFNLASATLGAGALALPSAMMHSGILLGSLFLLFVCLCTIYSVYVLIKVGERTDLFSFEELATELLGPTTEKLTGAAIVVFCWGVAVMYVVVMGDFISPLIPILGLESYLGRKTAMLVFWGLIMFPLSLATQINTLRFASIIGTISTLWLAVALVLKASDGTSPGLSEARLAVFSRESLAGLSTFVFSYCCQPVVFSVYSEMKNATVTRITRCASFSMTTCTLVYVVTGVAGALAFGNSTNPNVLSNFASHLDVPYVQLAFVGMAIGVTMAFPMTIFPTRDSVVMALGYREDENPIPTWLSSAIAGALAALALLMGMFVPNIRVLFDLLGGVCGGSLSFLLPGLFALKSGYWTVAEVGLVHHICAWILVLAGAGMCVLGTYNSIANNFF